jgi:hypothetical protein
VTAAVVEGRQVVSDTATASPHILDNAGQPLVWEQTRTLLLDDGSVTYGCLHCDYTNANMRSIRPHLSKHRHRPGRQPAMTTATGAATGRATKAADGLSLGEVLRKLGRIEQLEAERDEWKQRAVAAERSLKTLRKVLAP